MEEISPEQLKEILKNKDENIRIFDARSEKKYREGYLAGAEHWPDNRFGDEAKRIAGEIDKDTTVIFYCNFGVSSRQAADMFVKYYNHEKTYYVNGSSPRWLDEYYVLSPDYFESGEYGSRTLKSDDFLRYIGLGAVIVDPREKKEYEKDHFVNAVNIPITRLNYGDLLQLTKNIEIDNGIVIICYNLKSCDEGYFLDLILNEWMERKLGFSWGIFPLKNLGQ